VPTCIFKADTNQETHNHLVGSSCGLRLLQKAAPGCEQQCRAVLVRSSLPGKFWTLKAYQQLAFAVMMFYVSLGACSACPIAVSVGHGTISVVNAESASMHCSSTQKYLAGA
jgi:hypothetical protein